jgi:hypothetical protein
LRLPSLDLAIADNNGVDGDVVVAVDDLDLAAMLIQAAASADVWREMRAHLRDRSGAGD